MTKKLIGTLVVCALILTACLPKKSSSPQTTSDQASSTSVPDAWLTFKSDQADFQVSYPPTWKVEEQHTATSRGLKIYPTEGFAYVVVHAYKDDRLKTDDGMKQAVQELKDALQNDPDVNLTGFVGKKEQGSNVGGYVATGTETRFDKDWKFEEKGLMDTFGKVVLTHSALLPEIDDQSWQIIYLIENSFQVSD